MELQFYGANCFSITYKGAKIIVDDNLSDLGSKNITKSDDIALSTNGDINPLARLCFYVPGEYEVSEISIIGIPARSHMDEKGKSSSTMFKIMAADQSILITGHVYPELNETQIESIGHVEVMIVPVGGNGYTLDPEGALSLIKSIEPRIIIPSHFEDKDLKFPVPQLNLSDALSKMSMEPIEKVTKYKIKPGEAGDLTQLIVLEKSN